MDKEFKKATRYLAQTEASPQKRCCDHDLRGLPVLGWEHDGGYYVEGVKEKQWLYVVCPFCNYQMSFEHMGISRDRPISSRPRIRIIITNVNEQLDGVECVYERGRTSPHVRSIYAMSLHPTTEGLKVWREWTYDLIIIDNEVYTFSTRPEHRQRIGSVTEIYPSEEDE